MAELIQRTEFTGIDALEIGIKNSLKREDYKIARIRLDELKRMYQRETSASGYATHITESIDTVLEAINKYLHFMAMTPKEVYLREASQMRLLGYIPDEAQELRCAECAPTKREIEMQAEPYLQIIKNSPFMDVEDVCWVDGKRESVCFNEDPIFYCNIEGHGVNLCAEHVVDYQVIWRPEFSPFEPNILRYVNTRNSELYSLLMSYSL